MAAIYAQPPPPQNVVFMAPQQQQQGTLVPGQTITLKNYTVTVERYLSQGGFAHVYLVRSQTPINGTTHHVLKRIAVSDDVMLKEVQKEIDVMKVLRGHPNIVLLIDAATFSHSNGTYEVFILMEYCAGGGIIDMMNRRLRERLTEHEILQIFVDVLEGVACMHNLKPALLHRDLKVENILQAGEKSFKLCDFGSAATAGPKPATSAEMRALEQDILRHTTLQYRAPEMVEPYLGLPVDEKSDVWALGVLLYKLCYYTTPFEEHGPLAIVNVHYKIPSYPVYSPGMINLIGSMLQKYGANRPSVFSLLDTVHRMRGTRSIHSYRHPRPHKLNIPMPRPVSKRSAQAQQSQQQLPTPATTPTTMSPAHTPQPHKSAGPRMVFAPQRQDSMFSMQSNPCVVVVQSPHQPSRKGTYIVQQQQPFVPPPQPPQLKHPAHHPPPQPIRTYTYDSATSSAASTPTTESSSTPRSSSRSRAEEGGQRRMPSLLKKSADRQPQPQPSQRPTPPSRSQTHPPHLVFVAPPPPPIAPPSMPPQPIQVGGRRPFWARGN